MLEVRDLRVGLLGRHSIIEILSQVTLDVEAGEIIGLVGESGCGKSTLATSLLGLFEPPLTLSGGSVTLRQRDGSAQDLLHISAARLRQQRWRHIAYIPQGSMSALNPVLTVQRQVTDALLGHGMSSGEAGEATREALRFAHLDAGVLKRYPHQLSGGMRQRVAIAAAVSMRPEVLIADEPTTALDVVTQRMILQEVSRIRKELGCTIILISHDLGVMAQTVDRLAVMYAGRIVELSSLGAIFRSSLHPYTAALIEAIPKGSGDIRVQGMKGESCGPFNYPTGCRFHPRCPYAMEQCRKEAPALREHLPAHWVACYLLENKEVSQ
jgi:peptide/nickel transport system ATP-binding protein